MSKRRKVGRPKKPKGTGSKVISMWISEALLAQLRDAAGEAGHGKLSREISNRLRNSFANERNLSRDPATRAFGFFLAEVADQIRWAAGPNPWRHDRFLFLAFKMAFAKILDRFEPGGEIINTADKMIERLRQSENLLIAEIVESFGWTSPEAAADKVADRVMSDFRHGAAKRNEVWSRVLNTVDEDARADFAFGKKQAERTHYGMEQAAEDLGINRQDQRGKS